MGAFRDAHPQTNLLHFHNTQGTGLANLAALELERGRLRPRWAASAERPYAPGATGNIATEELVYMVEDMGVATGIDLEAMIAAAAEAERIVGRTLSSQVLRARPPDEDNPSMTDFPKLRETIERGGAPRYHEAAAARGKRCSRGNGSPAWSTRAFTRTAGTPGAGRRTARRRGHHRPRTIGGRTVAVMANDSTVKAGSWGARTVEKIIRIIEKATTPRSR